MDEGSAKGWPDRRVMELFGIGLPVLQAPMAGSAFADLAVAVSQAGGLGALACAMLSPERIHKEVASIRDRTEGPLNLNFFCHPAAAPDPDREARWRERLVGYFMEFGLETESASPQGGRAPFDEAACRLVEELRPEVVSFHFGLPDASLVERVKAAGAKVISTATTVEEARWLEARGCDAIIAQGAEAGGHRGMFLKSGIEGQAGTMALVPAVVDAVAVPVIAAGGISDARGIAAAFALGASAVQLGTAYLLCPEAATSPLHRSALRGAGERTTALTNVFTGRPARGLLNRMMRDLGPMADDVPPFPLPAGMLAPLRTKAEAMGSEDFSPLWAGQAAGLAREIPAGELTRSLVAEALARILNQS